MRRRAPRIPRIPPKPEQFKGDYRYHLVITRHVPAELPLKQRDGHPTTGIELVRPYKEARIFTIEHTNGLIYVYWIDYRLMLPHMNVRLDG